jgi:penicillin amidase
MPEIPGPLGPIHFTRDFRGYPSVRARDRVDAAFAHGWLIAVDRGVQVHLSLLAAEGRLLEVLGDLPVARTMDRITRALDFTGDAEAELAMVGPEMRAIVDAWCAGFGAGMARRGHPVVLRALGQPVRALTGRDTVVLYRLMCLFGLTSIQLAGELALTELLSRGASGRLVELLLGDAAAGVHPEAVAGADCSALGWFPPLMGGSNAAAVSAARSSTGSALLWGQPHMEIGRFPPVLYAAHLAWEGGSLTGIGIPGLPWLSYLRTPHVACAYTYGHADNVDVLVEECAQGQYRAGTERRALVRRDTTVSIRGKAPETWTFWDSPYGVVLGDAQKPGRYPCVRWSGLRRDRSDLAFVPRLERAQSAEEALELHRDLQVLSLHALVADSAGRIGYTLTGRVDQREADWSGAGPAAGAERTSREPAPLPEQSRPWVLDPPDGLWLSANERRDGPDGTRWITLPEPRWRLERLTERLAPRDKLGPDDLLQAMYDSHDASAAALLPRWRPLLDDPEFHALCDWAGAAEHPERDRLLSRFHALHDGLVRALLAEELGEVAAATFVDQMGLGLYFQWHLDQVLGLEKPALLDAAHLGALLRRVWSQTREGHPGVPLRTRFQNVFFQGRFPGFMGFDSEVHRLPGGPVSPFQTRRTTFLGEAFVFGPGANFVVDMGKPGIENNLPGGASEARFGPGYGSGLDAWLRGELFELGRSAG